MGLEARLLSSVLTAPTTAMPSPDSMTYRRPKMSLTRPATQQKTEEVIAHATAIQATFSTSPKSVPMVRRIDGITTIGRVIEPGVDRARDYWLVSGENQTILE